MNKIILFLFLYSNLLFAATIQGVIKNSKTAEPIIFCNVTLVNTNFGTSTDYQGFFHIENVPIGEYELLAATLSYSVNRTRIFIDSLNQVVELNIQLERIELKVPIVPEIEKYHSMLNSLNQDEILKIHVDSSKIINNSFIVYSTFENLSDFPIYVIKTIGCMQMVYITLDNDYLDKVPIKPNFIDCVGETTYPDSSDFIIIKPHSKEMYSPVKVSANNTYILTEDFKVSLTYEYQRFDIIRGVHSGNLDYLKQRYKDTFYYYNMAYRGIVESSNSLIFESSTKPE